MSKIGKSLLRMIDGVVSILKLVLGFCGLLILIAMIATTEQNGGNIILVSVVIALFFLCMITAMILRHRRLKRQQDIEILNADVNKMGDDEAARRAKKYQD